MSGEDKPGCDRAIHGPKLSLQELVLSGALSEVVLCAHYNKVDTAKVKAIPESRRAVREGGREERRKGGGKGREGGREGEREGGKEEGRNRQSEDKYREGRRAGGREGLHAHNLLMVCSGLRMC